MYSRVLSVSIPLRKALVASDMAPFAGLAAVAGFGVALARGTTTRARHFGWIGMSRRRREESRIDQDRTRGWYHCAGQPQTIKGTQHARGERRSFLSGQIRDAAGKRLLEEKREKEEVCVCKKVSVSVKERGTVW